MYKIMLFLIVLMSIISCNEHFSLTSPYTVDKEYVKSYDSCYDDKDCTEIKGKDYNCNTEEADGHKCICVKSIHTCQYICNYITCPNENEHGIVNNECDDKRESLCLCEDGYFYDEKKNQCLKDNSIKNFEISLGYNHTCAIKNGILYCWGSNDVGKLGIGNDNNSLSFDTPQKIGNENTWLLVSNTRDFTCALKRTKLDIYDANLYCWGKGIRIPKKVGDKKDWKQLVLGNNEILLLDKDGYLYNITDNSFNRTNINTPDTFPKNDNSQWLNISKGYFHYCGIKTDGKRYCMGTNYNGEFGNGLKNDDTNITNFIEINDNINWKDIKCGNDYTCGISNNDKIYCWGDNGTKESSSSDSLAVNSNEAKVTIPRPINSQASWLSITTGYDYTCGIRSDEGPHAIYCWGDNKDNQFGEIASTEKQIYKDSCNIYDDNDNNDDRDICHIPIKLKTNIDILTFKTNNYEDNSYKCIIDNNSNLYCWGHNDYKQLGIGDVWKNDASCKKEGNIIKCLLPIEVEFPELDK